LLLAFFLFACQPATPPTVRIIDGEQVTTLQTEERVVSALLIQAGITLEPYDDVLLNGCPVDALDQRIEDDPITLQIRRAVPSPYPLRRENKPSKPPRSRLERHCRRRESN
jgi:hypothetical protein